MNFLIETAKAIKPMIIRFGVIMRDDKHNIVGEYEIALDVDEYVTYEVMNDKPTVNVNAVGIQQALTTQIADMQMTSLIANGFIDLEWDAQEEDKDDKPVSPDLPTSE